MSEVLTEQEKIDLAYHERCRAVAKAMGGSLLGSSTNAGFTMIRNHGGYEVCHPALVAIEDLRQRAEQAETDRKVLGRELRSIGTGWVTVGKEVSDALRRAT